MSLPKVVIVGLGGTIAMGSSDVQGGLGPQGAVPTLTPEKLVSAVPQLARVAELSAVSLRMVAGSGLSIDDLLATAGEVRRCVEAGADGIVITQGTDTIEEIAFGLDLLVEGEAPVVVTGAMRNPTLPGADGPANLLAAVQVAASRAARGLGALVVFNDEIHAARFVQKTHTQSPAAFSSRLAGPIGWVAEGRVRVVLRPVRCRHILIPPTAPDRPVALLTLSLGDDGRMLRGLEGLGYTGLVVEAMGGGHVMAVMAEPLGRLAQSMPVVLASRTGCGEVLRRTYGFPGSESDLLARGLIPAGALDGPKARLLLTLLLRAGASRDEVARAFDGWMSV
jgi:L-asparaginase